MKCNNLIPSSYRNIFKRIENDDALNNFNQIVSHCRSVNDLLKHFLLQLLKKYFYITVIHACTNNQQLKPIEAKC